MTITYFESQVISLTYDEQYQVGIAEIKGFLSSEEFREVTVLCFRMIEEYKPLRWLADNRKMKAIRQADQHWYFEYAFPKLQACSIRRNAMVVSEDVFNQMAVEQLLKRADPLKDMLIKEFASREKALTWLKEPILT